MIQDELLRLSVKEHYKEAAVKSSGCGCGCSTPTADSPSLQIGYSPAEIQHLPEGTDLGLGCGNPGAIAKLRVGETVLDLGSGAGMDCILAARKVGEEGRVVGVDMTPEMVYKARTNVARVGLTNVEFRLGEIEHLPIEANFADVIISNCVINLSTEKEAVWREAFRVLKPGGRLAISDVAATKPVPEEIRHDVRLWSGCAAGASTIEELHRLLGDAGFVQVKVTPREESRKTIAEWAPDKGIGEYFVSCDIEAVKP